MGRDGADAVLTSPGVSGLAVMFAGMVNDTRIDKVFDEQDWLADRSFTFSELMELGGHLGMESCSSGGQQECQESSALERIVSRINSGSSPLLTPDDVPEGSTRDIGQWAQLFALQNEYALLQSFIDKAFAQYMESNPCDSELTMDQRKANWAYDNYYTCVREFFLEQAMDGGDWVRLEPTGRLLCLMPAQSLTASEREQMPLEALKDVKPCDVQTINVLLRNKWKSVLTAMTAYSAGLSKRAVLAKFLEIDYFPCLASALESVKCERDAHQVPSRVVVPNDIALGSPNAVVLEIGVASSLLARPVIWNVWTILC